MTQEDLQGEDLHSECSLDQGTFDEVNLRSGSECPSSYITPKATTAERILTTTGV